MAYRSKKKKMIGLALGSGGAKGFAHIGVIQALSDAGIEIGMIAGTSVGALVGAYLASHREISSLAEKIADKNFWKNSLYLFDPAWKGGVIKGEKLESLIDEWVGAENFEQLAIPFSAVATDLNTGAPNAFKKGRLAPAIRASFCVPGFFKPVMVNGTQFADGGLSDPVPDDVARRMGADIVVSVNLDSGYFEEPLPDNPALPQIIQRSLNIMQYHLASRSLADSDIVISPRTGMKHVVGWHKLFDRESALKLIRIGYESADPAISEIRSLLR